MLNWTTPIQYLPMVGPVYSKKLEKLEIKTVQDLLWHIPFRYEDYSKIAKIGAVREDEVVTIIGTVTKSKNQYLKNSRQIQRITVADETGEIDITWFNQPFIVTSMVEGTKVAFSGAASSFGYKLQFQSPEHELVREEKTLIHTGRLVPIYPETAGVSSKWLRSRIAPLLESPLTEQEYLPEYIKNTQQLLDIALALKKIHFPTSLIEAEAGKKRLAFDELFLLQLTAIKQKQSWHKQKISNPFTVDEEKIIGFLNSLPFTLTGAQKKVMREILADLTKETPMNRLLEGDVGSGKTVVAAIVAYSAHLNHAQTLFMAPTEILAEQHFQTLTNLLVPFGVKIGLQTGSQKSITKNNGALSGKKRLLHYDVLVGTHALIERLVTLDNIGLIVVDEQHRFGVEQRAKLREKGKTPHVLTMTATPIPRTIVLALHGDLDLSVLDEMPKNRLPVKTWVIPSVKRTNCYDWITKRIRENPDEAAFIVCPFIEPSESMQTVKAAAHEFEELKKVFPTLRLGLLHGKMPVRKKQKTLLDFKNGMIDILVCTPVVEVGIDISRATIMLIEAAERFGLAQLHQLRGRVGRGKNQAYCFLFTSDGTKTTSRLKALENTYNGLKLAEIDLTIRGPGEIYGKAQHGRRNLKIAKFSDTELIAKTRYAAQNHLKTDPDLTQNPLLKERITSATIHSVAPD